MLQNLNIHLNDFIFFSFFFPKCPLSETIPFSETIAFPQWLSRCFSLALPDTATRSMLGHLVPVSNNQKKRILTLQSGFQFGLEFVQIPFIFLASGAETEGG